MASQNSGAKSEDWREEEESLRKNVRVLQVTLGIDQDFLENLFNEQDDWSFVIKLNALIEAALTHVLTEEIGKQPLRDVFANTELGAGRSGKIAFATALGIFESDEKRFVSKLAEMRNAFVHNVRHVRTTIPEYLNSLETGERAGLLKALRYFAPAEVSAIDFPNGPSVNVDRFVAENPKLALWFSGMNFIGSLQVKQHYSDQLRAAQKEKVEIQARLAATAGDFISALMSRRRGDPPGADPETVARDLEQSTGDQSGAPSDGVAKKR